MPRFFVDMDFSTIPVGSDVLIDGENGRHLVKSLRIRRGESITLCDGRGTDAFCEAQEILNDSVIARLSSLSPSETEPNISVNLYQCITKSDKFDYIVQKAVELGADSVTPVMSEFCVAKLDGKEDKKISRWQKIALEAAKQSGRGKIPVINQPVKFAEAVKNAAGLKIMCYEHGGEPFTGLVGTAQESINIFIGSEGGFSEKEVLLAKSNDVKIATLGKRILRTETAPIAAISVVMALTGNLE